MLISVAVIKPFYYKHYGTFNGTTPHINRHTFIHLGKLFLNYLFTFFSILHENICYFYHELFLDVYHHPCGNKSFQMKRRD